MLAPVQIVVDGVAIATLGLIFGFTVMVTIFDVAFPGATTQLELLVITTLTSSPFVRFVLVNVVAPAAAAP